jgi:hypothetical protein
MDYILGCLIPGWKGKWAERMRRKGILNADCWRAVVSFAAVLSCGGGGAEEKQSPTSSKGDEAGSRAAERTSQGPVAR